MATAKVPKIMLNKSKNNWNKSSYPSMPIDLCNILNSPFLAISLIAPGECNPLIDSDDVEQALGDKVDLLLSVIIVCRPLQF